MLDRSTIGRTVSAMPRSLWRRHVGGATAAMAVALLVAGCGGSSSPAGVAESRTTPAAHRCHDRPGGITDLSDGGWRSSSGRRWTTIDGCMVRNDVLADLDGPAHCEWEAARLIFAGEPIGRRIRRGAQRMAYVRDPENVLDDATTAGGLGIDVVLPGTAADTGLRLGEIEMWAVPGDPRWIFLRGEETVERWPLDRDVPGCA
jgi:hypothetical protein